MIEALRSSHYLRDVTFFLLKKVEPIQIDFSLRQTSHASAGVIFKEKIIVIPDEVQRNSGIYYGCIEK